MGVFIRPMIKGIDTSAKLPKAQTRLQNWQSRNRKLIKNHHERMYSSIIQMHGTPNQNRIYIIRITKRQKKKIRTIKRHSSQLQYMLFAKPN